MKYLIQVITNCLPSSLGFALAYVGLDRPGRLLEMHCTEPAEYVAAAVMAVNTRGE